METVNTTWSISHSISLWDLSTLEEFSAESDIQYALNKCHFIQTEPHVELRRIIKPQPLTHKQDEAGPFVELHGVWLAELEHGPRVPGKEPALWVVQHLHPALSRDHVTLRVQQNQRGNTWNGERWWWWKEEKHRRGGNGQKHGRWYGSFPLIIASWRTLFPFTVRFFFVKPLFGDSHLPLALSVTPLIVLLQATHTEYNSFIRNRHKSGKQAAISKFLSAHVDWS